jgi:hypothetical protein
MKLKVIAAEMQSRLQDVRRGWVQRNLFGGLSVVLERRDNQWRLALARPNTLPSTVEENVAGEAFGVPAGVVWDRGTRPDKKGQRLWVTQCRWGVTNEQESEKAEIVGPGVAVEPAGSEGSGTPDADGAGVVGAGTDETNSQRGGHPG